ncbi:MAG: NADPH-dependent reductase [Firmicutes bacterium]|nr:NADPH-dependent reductase [Bacillota bacterium]
MKLLSILGSPNRNGNTARILDSLNKRMMELGHEGELIHLKDFTIHSCQGCLACQRLPGEATCVQKDDAQALFERVNAADAVIYASPLYGCNFSAPLKQYLDRHFCLARGFATPEHTSFIQGKRVAMLVTCGGPIENNASFVQPIFERVFAGFLKCTVIGKIAVPFCGITGMLDEQKADEAAEELFQCLTMTN